ncbi:hypothetical protein Gpo141_00011604 [Globisporangium polare]
MATTGVGTATRQQQQQQWGARPVSPQSPPEREVVARFCDFLESRMATKNFPLLRRMIGDYYNREGRTLEEFVELSVNLVAVLPFEETDAGKRSVAARILQLQQYQRQEFAMATGGGAANGGNVDGPGVFTYFQRRVGTKNMPWLKRIYSEFCDGREDALLDFVRSGVEAISILPVDLSLYEFPRWVLPPPPPSMPMQMQMPQLQMPFTENQLRVAAGHRDANYNVTPLPDDRVATPPTQYRKRAISDNDRSPSASVRTPKRSHHVKPFAAAVASTDVAAPSPDERELEIIRAEYLRIEATQPWTCVYHAFLESPFDMTQHANLTLALQRFLMGHGHALWERYFWLPMSKASDMEQLVERRKRQESAKKIFIRRVIKPVYKAFGVHLFLDLDARETRVEGWWYRRSVVDLGSLCRAKGLQFCLEYLRSQSRARFPETGIPELRVKTRGQHKWSKSMWSSDQAVGYILHAIRRAKGTHDKDLEEDDASRDEEDGDIVDADVEDVEDGNNDEDAEGDE